MARPKLNITQDMINHAEKLKAQGCNEQEIADGLGISMSSFIRHKDKFRHVLKKGEEIYRSSLIGKQKKKVKAIKDYSRGYIYIVQERDSNYYKIGISKIDPNIRLSALQVGNPRRLDIIYMKVITAYREIEMTLHQKYKEFNLIGEWFELSKHQLQDIYDYLNENSRMELFPVLRLVNA